jgi:hypothetical protein
MTELHKVQSQKLLLIYKAERMKDNGFVEDALPFLLQRLQRAQTQLLEQKQDDHALGNTFNDILLYTTN